VLEGHTADVNCLVFTPDGATLASGSGDDTIRLWQLDGAPRERAVLRGHTGEILALAMLARRQDAGERQPRHHRAPVAARLAPADGEARAARPYQQHLVRGLQPGHEDAGHRSRDTTVRLWDLDGPARKERAALRGHGAGVLAVAISPDGKMLASGSGDEVVRLWTSLPSSPASVPC